MRRKSSELLDAVDRFIRVLAERAASARAPVVDGGDGRAAWLGMDGPVPGVTIEDYEPDAALCAFIVADGLVNGARRFIADIELPSADHATPACGSFGRLGFTRPYVRTHWTRP